MNIGLVLSGGMAKGAYQVGALRAVAEYFKPEEIKYISSASIGVLNSYAFASGNMEGAAQLWTAFCEKQDRAFVPTILRGGYIKKSIGTLAQEELRCERLYVPLFHLKERQNFYVDLSEKQHDKIEAYLNAAVAVFPICKPVLIGNKNFYDGAVIDNIPVYPLLKHNIDYIICIYFDQYNYTFESKYFDNKIIKITFGDCDNMLSKSLWFTKEDTEEMICAGYKRAKRVMDFVFMSGTQDVEKVYAQIETLNSFNPHKQIRLTGDVVINSMNKVAQRVTRRKVIE